MCSEKKKSFQKVDTWFDIVDLEKNILDYWERNQTFQKLVKKNANGKKWSFLDGPITANNPMGVHHAWGRTLKDVYQRYWAMNGRQLRYQNGFDCQGLWVEVEVEKELEFKSKRDIESYGIGNFVEKCKERVRKYSDIISEQSKRLAFWMDWTDSYYTMSDENNYTIWTFLKKCHDRNLVFKGNDVMPWCPRCGTGISQHEMQEGYKEVQHLSVIVRFPIAGRENEAFLVWTTTPWTLTSNVAIALSPELAYVKVKQGDWIYYMVKNRADVVLNNHGDWEVLEELKGKDILAMDLKYNGPYDELPAQSNLKGNHRSIPWEEVSEADGTGIVHIAPGCGAEDFQLGKEFDLEAIAPIDENGLFIEGFDWFEGRHASEVGMDVINNLKEKSSLYSYEKYTHSYPHCWRCNQELLFRLVEEWYIAMDPWREEIKDVARQIEWIPSFGKELELDWLTNMRDWMISKKRYWGLALPIWECSDCGTFQVIGSKEELEEKAVEGWDKFSGNSPHKPWIDEIKIKCEKCGQLVSRIPDVGNPWLDAGIVPYSTVHYNSNPEYWKEWIPADLILECFPGQFRNWFYSLLAMSTMMENIPPFKTLVGHALVRDEKGEEMHKSQGNAIWFDDAADKIGVEVMRWIFCSHEIVSNLNFGYSGAKLIRGKFFNTLWNCYAFFVNYARLIDFHPLETPTKIEDRPDFDRWILSKLQLLVERCRKVIEKYDVRSAARAVDEFLEVLSNWYIRNNRRRYWRSALDSDTLQAYETLYEVLETVIRLLAPILPMMTEEIYQNLVLPAEPERAESIHLEEYPQPKLDIVDNELVEDMDHIVRIIGLSLSAREKSKIKVRQPLSAFRIAPGQDTEKRAVLRFSDLIKSELNVKEIKILEDKPPCPLVMSIRPSTRTLGQHYRGETKGIAAAIEKNVSDILNQIQGGSDEFYVKVNGETFHLGKEFLQIEEISPENLSAVRMGDGWLGLDTQLTEELLEEGMMRDFLRKMQVLRKEVGLEIEDRIHIHYATGSSKISGMIKRFEEFICSELLCVGMKEDSSVSDHEVKLGEESIFVRIEKSEKSQ